MNIFFHELKAYRKSTFVWTVSLVAILVLFMSLFPSFSKDIDEVNKLLEGFPEPVRKAIGLEIGSLGTILGYYSYCFLYLTLCGAIQAMNLGTSIISKEVREKTADFLLTKPITRGQIITAKILSALTSLLVTNVIFLIASNVTANVVKTRAYDSKAFLMISITLFFVQLIFLAIGLVTSVIVPKIKSVLTVSLGTVFAFFLIGMLASTGEDEVKRYLSPFKYFDHRYIIEHSSYELSFVIVGIGIVVISIVATFLIYIKRDIHTV